VRLQSTFYRGHDPQWAFTPLSGDGAAKKGGRFNPIGVSALYLATLDTMIVETTQGFSRRMDPLTIVEYEVDVADIVDLRTDDDRSAAGVELADMSCAWRLDRDSGRVPASWRIANRLRRTAAGILVPSFATGARKDLYNLVLWKWGADLPHRVTAYDPSGRLPRNQLSWGP
jgi:RES domain-containing protein